MQRRSILDARQPALLIAAVMVLAATGCAGSSSSSSGGSGPTASQPSSSAGGTTGTYVPAAGTDKSGAVFQSYTNPKLGYQLLYPGGWNVTKKAGIVRIAKLGNAIVIATRQSKNAPKVKPVRAALIQQQKKNTVLDIESRPKSTKLNGRPAIRMVFTKDKPATADAPEDTLRVYRYLVFHNGQIVILSLQTPTSRDNKQAYDLIANSLSWPKTG
ncbi:MAG: hypothetical protein ACJ738_11380 [Gaiellales bacterium]